MWGAYVPTRDIGDSQSARNSDDVSFCDMFANYFVSKIDSLKSAITSQLTDIVPPPPDPVCSYPSMQLLESVTSLEVSKLLLVIPPKSCCLDYIPTAIINNALLFSLTPLLTWLICPSLRAFFRPILSTRLSLYF